MAANAQAADLLERAGMRSEIAGGVTGALVADSAENGKIKRSQLQLTRPFCMMHDSRAGLMDLRKSTKNGRYSRQAQGAESV